MTMCNCNYCIDNYLTFENSNSKCPFYRTPIDIEDIMNCPICFEDMICRTRVKCKNCSKACCFICIKNWSNKESTNEFRFTCPLCRTPLKLMSNLLDKKSTGSDIK